MAQFTESSTQIESDLVTYQRISGWAIAAAVLGVLSAAAIVGPLLWCLPVAAVIVAGIAMVGIAKSEGRTSGWNLALLGLVLAVFFGTAGPARTVTRRIWLDQRAAAFARGFLELLMHNEPLAAHQLTQSAGVRKPLGAADLAEPYAKNENAKKDYDKFLELPLVKALLKAGKEAKIESLSSSYYGSDDRSEYVEVNYRMMLPSDTTQSPLEGLLFLDRSLSYGMAVEQWRIIMPAAKKVE